MVRTVRRVAGVGVGVLFCGWLGCGQAIAPVVEAQVLRPSPPVQGSVPIHKPVRTAVVQYSSMFEHEETGDILGWDVQLRPGVDGYDLTIFCGEGVPIGPVHGHVVSPKGAQVVQLKEDICGSAMTVELKERGVFLKVGDGVRDFVPRHSNFIKQELFK